MGQGQEYRGLDPLSARLVDDLILETRDRQGTPAELVGEKGGLAQEFFDASGIAAEKLVALPHPDTSG